MSVRCPQCFHENEEQYRFCGMCGVPLPRLGAASEESDIKVGRAAAVNHEAEPPRERPPVSESVPSFLGLSQDRDRSLDYLLEDEPEPGRWRTYLAVLLVVAAVAMLAWRWRHSGFFSHTRPAISSMQADATTNSPDIVSTPNASASSPAAAPATSSSSETTTGVPPTADGSGATDKSAQPASAAPSNDTTKSTSSGQTPHSEQAKDSSPEDSGNSGAKPEASAAATPVSVVKPLPTTPKIASKVSKQTAAPSAPPVSEQDPLVTQGEKYLYGNGVPQNCRLAEKSLLLAAQHANPKAQSVLGTMYATGHCVGRDLPTAYRWFAKASHQDPNNARITRDLEVLWKQMTAGERQLAVNNRE